MATRRGFLGSVASAFVAGSLNILPSFGLRREVVFDPPLYGLSFNGLRDLIDNGPFDVIWGVSRSTYPALMPPPPGAPSDPMTHEEISRVTDEMAKKMNRYTIGTDCLLRGN